MAGHWNWEDSEWLSKTLLRNGKVFCSPFGHQMETTCTAHD